MSILMWVVVYLIMLFVILIDDVVGWRLVKLIKNISTLPSPILFSGLGEEK